MFKKPGAADGNGIAIRVLLQRGGRYSSLESYFKTPMAGLDHKKSKKVPIEIEAM